MKKNIYIAISVVIVLLLFASLCFYIFKAPAVSPISVNSPDQNVVGSWVCQSGNWIKQGNPVSPKPLTACTNEGQTYEWQPPTSPPPSTSDNTGDLSDLIKVTSPKANDVISNGYEIKGEARGNWFFEASFPVKLLDASGKTIAETTAKAQGDWTTNNFVPFSAVLNFSTDSKTGELVLRNDNPSGLPEKQKELRIAVNFVEGKKITVKAYFGNSKLDPKVLDCSKVFPVEREVSFTEATARAALDELLKGPTSEEKNQGFFTSINDGVTIQELTIDKGLATVDFDKKLEASVGGSCKVSAIRAQITETLKQFPTIKNVTISIDGRTADILQP